jgi:uncharacterized protein (DUF1778 family)
MTPEVEMSKANLLTIRLTAEQRKRLNEAASREGLATGPWLRSMGLERARYLLDPAPPEYVHDKVEGVRRKLKRGA